MFYEISLASVHLQKTLKKYHYFQVFLSMLPLVNLHNFVFFY